MNQVLGSSLWDLKIIINLIFYYSDFPFLLLVFLCFVFLACGILAPQPGIELTPPALEGEVLTTRQGSPQSSYHKKRIYI